MSKRKEDGLISVCANCLQVVCTCRSLPRIFCKASKSKDKRCKLSDEDRDVIRLSTAPKRVLAAFFKVSQQAISLARRRVSK